MKSIWTKTYERKSRHGMFCHTFLEKKGEAVARGYVQANQAAVEEYRRLIRQEGIDCDFMETDAYVYSRDQEKLKRETEAAIRLGIPASMAKEIEIPVSCAGAVRFPSGSTKVICCWAGEVTAPETEGKTAALRR